MTKFLIFLILYPLVQAKIMVTDKFLDSLEHIESGGDRYAMGDFKNGLARAVGCLQLWEIYVQEANRLQSHTTYRLIDRKYPVKSREMTRIVLSHWGQYFQHKGIRITPAVLASLHRHPCGAWSRKEMESKHERKRTAKLLTYLKEH